MRRDLAAIPRPDKRGIRCADMRGGIAITDVCRLGISEHKRTSLFLCF